MMVEEFDIFLIGAVNDSDVKVPVQLFETILSSKLYNLIRVF